MTCNLCGHSSRERKVFRRTDFMWLTEAVASITFTSAELFKVKNGQVSFYFGCGMVTSAADKESFSSSLSTAGRVFGPSETKVTASNQRCAATKLRKNTLPLSPACCEFLEWLISDYSYMFRAAEQGRIQEVNKEGLKAAQGGSVTVAPK